MTATLAWNFKTGVIRFLILTILALTVFSPGNIILLLFTLAASSVYIFFFGKTINRPKESVSEFLEAMNKKGHFILFLSIFGFSLMIAFAFNLALEIFIPFAFVGSLAYVCNKYFHFKSLLAQQNENNIDSLLEQNQRIKAINWIHMALTMTAPIIFAVNILLVVTIPLFLGLLLFLSTNAYNAFYGLSQKNIATIQIVSAVLIGFAFSALLVSGLGLTFLGFSVNTITLFAGFIAATIGMATIYIRRVIIPPKEKTVVDFQTVENKHSASLNDKNPFHEHYKKFDNQHQNAKTNIEDEYALTINQPEAVEMQTLQSQSDYVSRRPKNLKEYVQQDIKGKKLSTYSGQQQNDEKFNSRSYHTNNLNTVSSNCATFGDDTSSIFSSNISPPSIADISFPFINTDNNSNIPSNRGIFEDLQNHSLSSSTADSSLTQNTGYHSAPRSKNGSYSATQDSKFHFLVNNVQNQHTSSSSGISRVSFLTRRETQDQDQNPQHQQ